MEKAVMPEPSPRGGEGQGKKVVPDAQAVSADAWIITEIYQKKCHAALKALPTVLPTVWEYCQKHIAAGRLWPTFNGVPIYPFKLLELWHILQTEKPRSILELGSGCTTAVFAHYEATAEPRGIHFETVDEDSTFQRAVIADIVEHVSHASVREVKRDDTYAMYKNLPIPDELDFQYVDGPTNEAPDGKKLIGNWCYAKTVVFDIRRETVKHNMREPSCYSWDLSCFQESGLPWYLSAVRHHTIARRRA